MGICQECEIASRFISGKKQQLEATDEKGENSVLYCDQDHFGGKLNNLVQTEVLLEWESAAERSQRQENEL